MTIRPGGANSGRRFPRRYVGDASPSDSEAIGQRCVVSSRFDPAPILDRRHRTCYTSANTLLLGVPEAMSSRLGRRRRQLATVSAATSLVVSVLATPQAEASDYGPEIPFPNLPDSADHYYCLDASVPSAEHGRYDAAMQNLDAQTAMYDVKSSTCAWATDVHVFEVGYGAISGNAGVFSCPNIAWYDDRVCEQGDIQVSPSNIFVANGGWNGDASIYNHSYTKTIRHEVGHSAGLDHYNTDGPHAMYSGLVTSTASSWHSYRAHDVCHIDGWINNGDWTGCK